MNIMNCCSATNNKTALNLSFEKYPALNQLCDSILDKRDISIVIENINEVVREEQINEVDSNNGYSILHVACSLPNYAAIYELLKVKDIEINTKHKLGVSPIKLLFLIQLNIVKSVPTNNLEDLKELLRHEDRFDLDDIDIDSLMTLAILTTKKNQGTVNRACIASQAKNLDELLKERKIEKFKKANRSGFIGKMLLRAVTSKDIPLLRRLLGQLTDNEINDGSSNPYNYTALHMAAGDGSVEAVGELLKVRNIDLNVRGADGYTPIMVAAWSCNVGVVAMLLKQPNVNLDYVDKLGRTLEDLVGQKVEKLPHFQSSSKKQEDLKLEILSRIEEMNEIIKMERDIRKLRTGGVPSIILNQRLCDAIRLNDRGSMTEALEMISSDDLNKQDMNGYTPLHWACVRNNKDALTVLLKFKDIDVNAEDIESDSALIRAAWLCKKECLEILLNDDRVDLGHGDDNGRGITFMTGKGLGCTKKQIQEVSIMIKKEFNRRYIRDVMVNNRVKNIPQKTIPNVDKSVVDAKRKEELKSVNKKKKAKKTKSKRIIENNLQNTEIEAPKSESIVETIQNIPQNVDATESEAPKSESVVEAIQNVSKNADTFEAIIENSEVNELKIIEPITNFVGNSDSFTVTNKITAPEIVENTVNAVNSTDTSTPSNECLNETDNELKKIIVELKDIENELEELNKKESKELELLFEKQNQIENMKHSNETKMESLFSEECALQTRYKEIQAEKMSINKNDSELDDKLSKVANKKSRIELYINEQRKKLETKYLDLDKNVEILTNKSNQIKEETNSKSKHPQEDNVISNSIFDFSMEKKKLDDQFIEKQINFLDKQMESIESNLECPVCLESASSPIYQCIESHLICSTCLPRVSSCPECRQTYWNPPQRNRYAENDALRLAMLGKEKQAILMELSK